MVGRIVHGRTRDDGSRSQLGFSAVPEAPPEIAGQAEPSSRPVAAEPGIGPRLVGSTRSQVRTKVAVDVAMLVASALAAVWSLETGDFSTASIMWLALYPALMVALLSLRGVYTPRLRVQLLDELRDVVFVTSSAAMFMFAVRALLYDNRFHASQGVRQWLFAVALLSLGRICLAHLNRRRWARGDDLRRTLIIGAGSVGQLVATRLAKHPEWGLLPVGFLDPDPPEASRNEVGGLPVLGASFTLDLAASELDVRHVIVAFSSAPYDVLLRIAKRCEEVGLMVSVVPRLLEQMTEQVTVEHIGGLPLLTPSRTDPRGWQFAGKYAADRVLAGVALVLFLPILALAAAAAYMSVGRPILYRQPRVGLDGQHFELLKLRSMHAGPSSPAAVSPVGLQETYDERLTRVGRFLRATSLDELPQLINVLRGEMSLVGPRPERPDFAVVFEQLIHGYRDRHRVKSGITGWAQVHGIGRGFDRFSEASLTDRVEWDNHYIENWSLWLDVKILLMTVAAVLHFRQPTHALGRKPHSVV